MQSDSSGSSWHHAFDPSAFLRRVDVAALLERNDAYEENRATKLGRSCFACGGGESPGLLLNEGSFLCKGCFDRVSLIRYPERYEALRRQYLVACEARRLAREDLVRQSFRRRCASWLDGVTWLSLLLLFVHFWFGLVSLAIFLVASSLKGSHERKVKEWSEAYPEPLEPQLKHFHDPSVELTDGDKKTLHIFEHWPGYPPFWKYLRQIVLSKDEGRCQVTGCPSRLELHVHHMVAVSQGGRHCPDNLVSLCDFHHALEPEKGHERIWETIKTRYFTLVREHERLTGSASGVHKVRRHLRRLQLVTSADIANVKSYYGFVCPHCRSEKISIRFDETGRAIEVSCPTCAQTVSGPRQLAEETGPRLAEMLCATRKQGRWKPRWDLLAERAHAWGTWTGTRANSRRRQHRERIERDAQKPACPLCKSPMRLVSPKPGDRWQPFWGCIRYRTNGCKGAVRK